MSTETVDATPEVHVENHFHEAPAAPAPTNKKAKWKAAKVHEVTCPSGMIVSIQIPNLPALIKAGRVPNELLEAALGAGPDTEVTKEMVEKQADFYNYLVSITVTDPSVEPHEVGELPYEDIEMIVSLALRQRDMDAVYKHIGGLDRVASFRDFRRRARRGADVDDV